MKKKQDMRNNFIHINSKTETKGFNKCLRNKGNI